MTTLTDKRVSWIYKQLVLGELSIGQIAKTAGVTPRRIRQLKEYERSNGRKYCLRLIRPVKIRPDSKEEKVRVIHAYGLWKLSSTLLERILRKQNTRISHNRIQRILNEANLGVPLNKKIKRKDWVRYERKHSNSLWHTDWTLLDGLWLIAYLDDASRKIVAWGLFDSANVQNSVDVLKEAIKTHGKPKAILTGHDVQFFSNGKEGVPATPNGFQQYLAVQGIEHTLGRVNHPQTNGKIERWFGTVKQKRHLFGSMDELVHWYNEIKPHMSLNLDELETPAQAYARKMHHKVKSAKKQTVIVEVSK